ncbi:hypothetical protein BA190_10100 [Labrys sp. WJW]|uniref:hypothetical protein n=1 Tax=Labrys sp. WJW TaxID=1737983 RepID=UPI00082E35A1|nr:hypothetical protein [Labrys sp. WJW]OCC05245.1 hypothetical protein BA190_10100 [Labrys sp. WJW]
MRSMDIERVLRWAYVDELPHAKVAQRGPATFGRGWANVESYAQLLTVIDCNAYGVVPDIASQRLPHPDAYEVGDMVDALADLELALPEDWDPFADVAGEARPLAMAAAVRAIRHLTIIDDAGRQRLRRPVQKLILRHAIMGTEPDWQGEAFEVKVERNTYGQPAWFRRVLRGEGREAMEVEVDGFDAKRRRPYHDAYQRFYLDPDAFPVAIARAEYELWHSALSFLAEELAGRLQSIRLLPLERAARPWETGPREGRRILFSLCA